MAMETMLDRIILLLPVLPTKTVAIIAAAVMPQKSMGGKQHGMRAE